MLFVVAPGPVTLLIYNFIYMFLALLCLHAARASLVVVSSGCSVAAVYRLLSVVSVEHTGFSRCTHVDSAIVAPGL